MVQFIITNETDSEITKEQLDELERVAHAIMDGEDCNFDAEVSLTFTDNESIRIINRDYRDTDSDTDVLSFPMLDFGEDEVDAEFETENGLVMLGDIVISLERAAEQAKEYGHSMRRELAFLVAHSMLHLLGRDHIDDEDGERYMIDQQNKILNNLGITRDGV